MDETSIWSSDKVDFPASLGWEFFDEVHIDRTVSVEIGNEDIDGRAVFYVHKRLAILAVSFRGTQTGTFVPGFSEEGTNWNTNCHDCRKSCCVYE